MERIDTGPRKNKYSEKGRERFGIPVQLSAHITPFSFHMKVLTRGQKKSSDPKRSMERLSSEICIRM